MTAQRELIPEVIQEIQQSHPDCSIILIGSVARKEERPDSDLDLNIFFADDSVTSPWATSTNRWQLQVVCEMRGVRVDVAWETFDFLDKELQTEGPFWILSYGEIICDPSGRVAPCLQMARSWASENRTLCEKMEAEFRTFKQKQLAKRRKRT